MFHKSIKFISRVHLGRSPKKMFGGKKNKTCKVIGQNARLSHSKQVNQDMTALCSSFNEEKLYGSDQADHTAASTLCTG